MGRWAQARARGSSYEQPGTSSAPVLSYVPDFVLEWTWGFADPETWRTFESISALGPWSQVESDPGTDRTNSVVVPGLFYYIIGQTAGGVDQTLQSNILEAV